MTTQRPAVSGLVQFVPTVERILYGAGVVQQHLAAEVERLRAERVLLITPRSLEHSPFVEQVRSALGGRHAGSFAAAFEHVPLASAVEAAQAARRVNADLVVALGGGSAIDAAKGARTCLAADLPTVEALGAFMAKPLAAVGAFIPQVSIPTTLSGAEYSRSFSATDFDQGVKRAYTNSGVASKVILYDPAATTSTPDGLWFASGVMAIAHAVEVYWASPPHLVGDALKLASAKDLLAHLPRTRLGGDDLEERLRCQVAAWLADHSPLRTQPLAPAPGALPVHALAYELGALCKVGYGLVACVTLPACLRWSAARDPYAEDRQAKMSREFGLAPDDASDADAAEAMAARLRALIALLGLPTRLREVNVSRRDIGRIARSFSERKARLIAERPASEEDVARLLEENW
ncbi:MAG: iron-containing alcohol dehydrogenase [Dehalococcoidia bacterium]|nr:iron-containing alcohol dehydrogenase [Dehalococcoidia bacterium]